MARLRAVFFDVGKTLVEESREYGTWADSRNRWPTRSATRSAAAAIPDRTSYGAGSTVGADDPTPPGAPRTVTGALR